MKIKTILLLALVLGSMVFISGCSSQTQLGDVKSQEDVQETVSDVSTNIGNVESTLKDIETTIG